MAVIDSTDNLEFLDEEQNAAFDVEYHTPLEYTEKLARYKELFPGDEPIHVLDAGGGNGTFSDWVIRNLPNARVTVLDISDYLLDRNVPHERKTLVKGNVMKADEILAGQKFDIVAVNWLLHHLVADNYASSVSNQEEMLRRFGNILTDRGVVSVGENMYNAMVGKDMPSRLIYELTACRNPLLIKAIKSRANTAGVGVCFHSEKAWADMFKRCGFEDKTGRDYGYYWPTSLTRRVALNIKDIRHGHFCVGKVA
ncbi:MAG: class I SAM-dependent methyltransferase [Pseudomonadota bacterium]